MVLCSATNTSAQDGMVCDMPAEGFALVCGQDGYNTVPTDGTEIMFCGTMFNGSPIGFDCESSAFDPGTMMYYVWIGGCLLYTSPSPRDATLSRMPSSA